MNAAVWFGAAVFFTLSSGPVVSSADMQQLLGPKNHPFFSVAIGQLLATRYYHLQLACSIVALLHLGAEWIYLGKSPKRTWFWLLLVLFCFGLIETLWLQPSLRRAHLQKYAADSQPEQRERARRFYVVWQPTSQGLNIIALGVVALYLWRLSNPPEPARFVMTTKFRG